MTEKDRIFKEHFERSKKLHIIIKSLYKEIWDEHDTACTATAHNKCLINPMDERLTNIVMLEKEIIVIRRQLKRDILRYEDDPVKKAKRLAILKEIEKIQQRALSSREEYAEL